MGIYHLLKMIVRKEKAGDTTASTHLSQDDSKHPVEIQLR